MNKFLLGLIFVVVFSNAQAQSKIKQSEIFVMPFYFTEIGLGISLGYQFNFNDKLSLAIPVSANWNVNKMLYGPAVTDVYKSTIYRIMPSLRYHVFNHKRIRYGVGLGASIGLGNDDYMSRGYEGTFYQNSIFVDNSFTFFNKNRSFGIGLDLGIGYHLRDNILPQYVHHYSYVFAKGGIKLLIAF